MNKLDYDKLTREKRKIPDKFEPLRLRVHRAISWGKHAQQVTGDIDARFIFFWIGFNALYSRDLKAVAVGQSYKKALEEIQKYLEGFIPLNRDGVHNLFWKTAIFKAGISLMEDKYLYKPFWVSRVTHNENNKWRAEWNRERTEFIEAEFLTEMQKKKIPDILTRTIFSRLCVLRNQVMHGSATRRSKYNRDALGHGVKLLERTLPVFIDLMIKNPSKKWGTPHFLPDGKQP